MSTPLGTVGIHCPACDEIVKITVLVDIVRDDDGTERLIYTEENMADLWAHTWTHEGGA